MVPTQESEAIQVHSPVSGNIIRMFHNFMPIAGACGHPLFLHLDEQVVGFEATVRDWVSSFEIDQSHITRCLRIDLAVVVAQALNNHVCLAGGYGKQLSLFRSSHIQITLR